MRYLLVPRSLAAALFLLSVLFTCGVAAAQAPPAGPLILEGTLSEYFIYLPQQSGPAGTVRFVVQNIGERRHNLRVVGNGVDKATPDLRPGQTGEVEVFFTDPGPYTVYC